MKLVNFKYVISKEHCGFNLRPLGPGYGYNFDEDLNLLQEFDRWTLEKDGSEHAVSRKELIQIKWPSFIKAMNPSESYVISFDSKGNVFLEDS